MSDRPPFATTCVLALSLVTLPLRLETHIHPAGIEGRDRALVHTHLIQDDTTPGIRVGDHGNHGRAIFLTTVFESAAKETVVPIAAVFVPSAASAKPPSAAGVKLVVVERIHRSPGPPGGSSIDRAPPRV